MSRTPGTRVLITGAAGGIGSAAITELRAHSAEVVGLDLYPGESGELIACDVRDQTSVDAAVAAGIERLGGLDVLINCAGIGLPQRAGARPDASAEAVLDVNLMGTWRVTGAALDALLESGGRVVNVASGLAHLTVPLAAAYCASKRAVVAYSDALRLEHGDRISVTTVYPGYIRTPIHDAAAEEGIGLEGAVPAEPVSAAAEALTRAALASRPIRDLATTRRGTTSYTALRFIPRGTIDRGVIRNFRRSFRNRSELATGRLTGPIAGRLGIRG